VHHLYSIAAASTACRRSASQRSNGTKSTVATRYRVVTDAATATDLDVYQAKIKLVDDDAGTTDRWIVVWHKNGNPVEADITSPLISLVSAAGTSVIAETAMTEIGTTEIYQYGATGGARIVDGTAYVVTVKATIDGAVRTAKQPIGQRTEAA
jgi:hypothetical protein